MKRIEVGMFRIPYRVSDVSVTLNVAVLGTVTRGRLIERPINRPGYLPSMWNRHSLAERARGIDLPFRDNVLLDASHGDGRGGLPLW